MEAIVEVVLQFALEVVGELPFEAGYHGVARVLRSPIVRFAAAAGIGFGGGLWWGARLAEVGRVEEPRALWVSLGLAAGMGLAALWRRSRSRGSTSDSVMAPPRRWPAWRLAGFSVLNLAVAAGIAVGFHPRPLG